MRYTSLKRQQAGLVSIIVTTLLMVVLTLIVVGFAKLSQREQRQALDRQLNTQAFYAAETAVNDARSKFGSVDLALDYTSSCNDFITAANLTTEKTIDAAGGVGYTCLLVDPSPTSLEFGNVAVGKSEIFQLRSKNNEAVQDLTVKWRPTDADNHVQAKCPTDERFPSSWPTITSPSDATGCKTGVIEVEIVPYNGTPSRNTLVNDTGSVFLYPRTNNETITYSTTRTSQGEIISGTCTAQGECSVTITALNSVTSYVKLSSFYQDASVSISAKGAVTNPLELAGVQANVDATGQANDVLRRIQVRVSIDNFGASFPEFGIQTAETQCKRFSVAPPAIIDNDTSAECALD